MVDEEAERVVVERREPVTDQRRLTVGEDRRHQFARRHRRRKIAVPHTSTVNGTGTSSPVRVSALCRPRPGA